jgi:hypothetical protein
MPGVRSKRGLVHTLLAAGQVSRAEPLIRQYLEYKLQQIIRKVDIPVPINFAIKDTLRMVSNCLDAVTTAVDLQKRGWNADSRSAADQRPRHGSCSGDH